MLTPKNRSPLLALLSLAVSGGILFSNPAAAETHVVPSLCCSTIQQGLDVAASGDTVLVLAGTYVGPGNVELLFRGKSMTLRGQDRETTILDGRNANRLVHIDSGPLATARLEDLTLMRGSAGPTGQGGGIRIEDNGFELRNCHIVSCTASRGGGLYCSNATVTIEGCTFEDNGAFKGGGMYLAGGTTTMVGGRVVGNYTNVQSGWGAGVYGVVGHIDIIDTVVSGNRVTLSGFGGGGLLIDGCTTLLRGVTIAGNLSENYAGGGGGGLNVTGGWTVIERCAFYENCDRFGGYDIYSRLGVPEISCTYINDVNGEVQYLDPPIVGDVSACVPISCLDAPTSNGEYTISDESVLLPQNNDCGALIGAIGEGCRVAGVEAGERVATLRVFPTPARHQVQLLLPFETTGDVEIALYDASGRVLGGRASGVKIENGEATISLDGLAAGTYYVRVRAGERIGEGRVVVLP